jgi:hypothetical protein
VIFDKMCTFVLHILYHVTFYHVTFYHVTFMHSAMSLSFCIGYMLVGEEQDYDCVW